MDVEVVYHFGDCLMLSAPGSRSNHLLMVKATLSNPALPAEKGMLLKSCKAGIL